MFLRSRQTTLTAKIFRGAASLHFYSTPAAGAFPHPDRGSSFFWGSDDIFWVLRPVSGCSGREQSIERAYGNPGTYIFLFWTAPRMAMRGTANGRGPRSSTQHCPPGGCGGALWGVPCCPPCSRRYGLIRLYVYSPYVHREAPQRSVNHNGGQTAAVT